MADEVLAALALLCTGVTAGVLVAVAVSVVPALAALPPDRYVQAHQLLGRNWDPMMPLIVLTGTGTSLALAVLAGGGDRALFGAAAALMLGTAGVSHLLNVPLNREVKRLDPDGPIAADWADPRPRWRRWHLFRTAFAALGFAAVTLAVVS